MPLKLLYSLLTFKFLTDLQVKLLIDGIFTNFVETIRYE
jgi:hypothetical protein